MIMTWTCLACGLRVNGTLGCIVCGMSMPLAELTFAAVCEGYRLRVVWLTREGRNCFMHELLTIVTGDATRPQGHGPAVIAHVCNDAGRWGSGFVLAISGKWPQPERAYRQWYRERAGNDFALGSVQLVLVQPGLRVANMVAQHDTVPQGGRPPIRYAALRLCLDEVGSWACVNGASVHMPRIGCGLAGGSWKRIEPIVIAALCERGVRVTVYDLPQMPPTVLSSIVDYHEQARS